MKLVPKRTCVIPGGRGSVRAGLRRGSPGGSPSQDRARAFSSSTAYLVATVLVFGCSIVCFADDSESQHQLNLADLAAYRAALSGKATGENAKTSDPPVRVGFRDLWNRPNTFRGRRVTIEGRVERIFRQGPIGSFPALAEVWIVSPAGDPFCLVVPNESGTGILPVADHGLEDRVTATQSLEPGQTVQFTGTFLKMVRYAGGDGPRLAPLIVGDQPPVPAHETKKASDVRTHVRSDEGPNPEASLPASWLLGLTMTMLIAGVLVWQYSRAQLRRPSPHSSRRRTILPLDADPTLEFIENRDDH